MSWSDPGLIVNALVAVLLVAVIVHAVMLNRRLKTWRAEAGEMERLIIAFNAAIVRAEAALAGLKQATREDGQTLDVAQRRAQALRDDLAYLSERGAGLADRLEEAVRGALPQVPSEPTAAPEPAPPKAAQPKAVQPKSIAKTAVASPPPAPDSPAHDSPVRAASISDAEKRLKAALETMR